MRKLSGIVVLLFLAATSAMGQEVTVQVTQLAGDEIYLNAGQDAGIATGDTLEVFVEGENVGQLVVIFAASSQSVTMFANAPFAVTRGAFLGVIVPESEDVPAVAAEEPVVDVPEPTPAPGPRTTRPSTARQTWRTSGRVMLNFYGLKSSTGPISRGAPRIDRTFATPSLSLNSTIQTPDGQTRIRINMRSDYRYSSIGPGSEGIFRAYQLNIERDFAFGSIQAGRFYHYQTPLGGYWDGVSFMLGSKKRGIGASVGFMPERSNEGFTSQFPRFSVFGNWRSSFQSDGMYQAALSYHEIHPSSQYLTHRYLGASQRLRWKAVRLDQELQLDQDPSTAGWTISRLRLRSTVNLTREFSIQGHFSIRQPYSLYRIDRPFSHRREQAGGGIIYQTGRLYVGARFSSLAFQNQANSQTVSGNFRVEALPGQLAVSGAASYWSSDLGTSLYLSGGVSRPLGKGQVRLQYGYYETTYLSLEQRAITTHRGSINLNFPISRTFYLNVNGSLQMSEQLTSGALQTSLQIRF